MLNNLPPLVGRYDEIGEGNAVRFDSIFSNAGADQSRVYNAEDRRDTMSAVRGGETGLGGWKQGNGLR